MSKLAWSFVVLGTAVQGCGDSRGTDGDAADGGGDTGGGGGVSNPALAKVIVVESAEGVVAVDLTDIASPELRTISETGRRAAVSPDGAFVAYTTGEVEIAQLALTASAKGTGVLEDDVRFEWSPTSEYFVVEAMESFVVEAATGTITKELLESAFAEWSPDGSWGQLESSTLYSPASDGFVPLPSPDDPFNGTWHPTQPRIAYRSQVQISGPVTASMADLPVGTTDPVRVEIGTFGVSNLAWSGDGRWVIFGTGDVSAIDTLGALPATVPEPVLPSVPGGDSFSWRVVDDTNYVIGLHQTDTEGFVYLVELNGPPPWQVSTIFQGAGSGLNLTLSTREGRYAFRAGDELWVGDVTAVSPEPTMAALGTFGTMTWLPGAKVLWIDGPPSSYSIEAETFSTVTPADLTATPFTVGWSHDLTRVAFIGSDAGGVEQVWAVDIESDPATAVPLSGLTMPLNALPMREPEP